MYTENDLSRMKDLFGPHPRKVDLEAGRAARQRKGDPAEWLNAPITLIFRVGLFSSTCLAFTLLLSRSFFLILDATTHLYKRSCPSVRPSVPSYFQTPNMAVFEGKKSSTDIVNNGTMSADEVVASDVPPRYTCLD